MAGKKKNNPKAPAPPTPTKDIPFERKASIKSPELQPSVKPDQAEDKKKI
jgi:hypothetical protein